MSPKVDPRGCCGGGAGSPPQAALFSLKNGAKGAESRAPRSGAQHPDGRVPYLRNKMWICGFCGAQLAPTAPFRSSCLAHVVALKQQGSSRRPPLMSPTFDTCEELTKKRESLVTSKTQVGSRKPSFDEFNTFQRKTVSISLVSEEVVGLGKIT